ncbi:AcrR family transcriptional regulator [Nocardioides zeae]|uniref:AcrR family transcriptional regulator n=2 Tax=Nocardioides zeae TaxID=1457234 RepID=A0AAJ1U2L2_9ACTN|nr:TetR/AcrR family transcriptional regulator [Nocardioides zeae]MDQ1103067.1 AcrR family transcriptional regulator [Nocardioides zeae]MDR6173213.1 AcrR family transcriptional regulator [Nocardioides zeae]MDR6210206.1 AcrR family transcriptional regulator [Nocardioides zeae]
MTVRGEDMRARVLRAALDELSVTGVVGISLRAIARRVGMTHQAISHYFTSRSALFTQLAVEGFGALRAEIRETLAALPEADPADPTVDPADRAVDRVAAVGAAYLRFAEEQPALFDLLYGGGASLTDGGAAFDAARAAVWQEFFPVVAHARDHGWGGDVGVEDLGLTAWAVLLGMTRLRAHGLRSGVLAEGPEAMARSITSLVRR